MKNVGAGAVDGSLTGKPMKKGKAFDAHLSSKNISKLQCCGYEV